MVEFGKEDVLQILCAQDLILKFQSLWTQDFDCLRLVLLMICTMHIRSNCFISNVINLRVVQLMLTGCRLSD